MTWESRYLPPDPHIWSGVADSPDNHYFFQQVHLLNFMTQRPPKASAPAFALIGFKCDEGLERDLTRTGAKEAPAAIRRFLAKLPLHRHDVILYDIGNIVCDDHDMEKSQEALAEVIHLLLSLNVQPIVLGGSHELSLGHYQGITKSFPSEKKLAILNFDAHFDLHPTNNHHRSSASTTFYEIAEDAKKHQRPFQYYCAGIQSNANDRDAFKVAKQLETSYLLADEFHLGRTDHCYQFVEKIIAENDLIYMSISLDVLSPAFAPGVSTIQPLGLSPWHIIPLIRKVAASGKGLSFDMVEYNPRYDIDHRTAKLAAVLVTEFIHAIVC